MTQQGYSPGGKNGTATSFVKVSLFSHELSILTGHKAAEVDLQYNLYLM
jgi:hypothetical protein